MNTDQAEEDCSATDPEKMCPDCKEGFEKRMRTEQVVEMIDAISEGRSYTLHPGGDTRTEINFEGDEISVFPPAHEGYFDINDPRAAREIAAALIAWANRKDEAGTIEHKTESPLSDKVDAQLNLYMGMLKKEGNS